MTERQHADEILKEFTKNENENLHVAKFNLLPPDEKQLILSYLYYEKIKDVAKKYKCSASWMGKKLKVILQKLR